MQSVFLTGGSGYLGRNIIRALAQEGASIRALVRSADARSIVEAHGAAAVLGDLCDVQALTQAMQGCDAMIHAAADTGHGPGFDPRQERTNVEGTRCVFRAAREAGVARALLVSTESVLADGRPIVMANESWPMPESHAGGYARSKARAEAAAFAEAGPGFAVCAIRPRFIWGRDDTSALPQLVQAVRDGRLKWIDGGTYLTSTTHVANVVHGALQALRHGRSGQAYFLSDGTPLPFREFVTRLLATQDVEAPAGSVPRWLLRSLIALGTWFHSLSGGRIRPLLSWQEYATVGHEVTVDDSLAREQLGYAPVITIDAGLAELAAARPVASR